MTTPHLQALTAAQHCDGVTQPFTKEGPKRGFGSASNSQPFDSSSNVTIESESPPGLLDI